MDHSNDDEHRTDGPQEQSPGPPAASSDNSSEQYAPGADDTGDDLAGLNTPPEPAPADAGEHDQAPFVVQDADLMDEEKKGPSKAATFVAFAVVVMAVLGILMTTAAVKLYLERGEMLGALEGSATKLATAYGGPEADDASKRRIAWLQNTLDEGDYAQAQKAIQSLGAPTVDRPPAVESPLAGPDEAEGQPPGDDRPRVPSPENDANLPLKAQAFFEQHPDLWEAFFGFSVAIRRMQQAEMDVAGLRELRAQMVEAATEGKTQKVEQLLQKAREALEGQSNQQLPESLRDKLQQFRSGMQQAQKERRDVRAAVELAKRSEQAARQGDVRKAERLMNRALSALENAPKMRMPQRPQIAGSRRQAPQMGPQVGLLKYIADLTAKVMRAEEKDLTQVWKSINIAAGAIREKNAEQVREILGEAKDALHDIGDRRREMSEAITEIQQKTRRPEPENEPGEGATGPDERARQRQQMIVRRVAGILAKVREMPQEQFEANRAEIAQAVLKAMTAPMQAPTEQRGPSLADLPPEQRVRRKMEIAGEMYLTIKTETDLDRSELDETFSEVRTLISQHKYEEAEKLVDRGVKMMREMAEGLRPTEREPEDSGGYGPQLRLDAPSPGLDLQPDMGEPPAPAPTGGTEMDAPVPAAPPAELPDDIDEGAEQ